MSYNKDRSSEIWHMRTCRGCEKSFACAVNDLNSWCTECRHQMLGCPKEPLTQPASAIDSTLKDRGEKYGEFRTHAEITQKLKFVVSNYNGRLAPMHQEALDMIMHKIARILNGDPNYADSWHDIAGYATLVEKRVSK